MYDMMRRSISSSRSSPLGLINNRSSSFPRLSLFLSCLGNQTTTTAAATNSKVLNKSIYYYYSSWSQYHSRQHHQSCGYGYACQNQRFMFKYYCCPTAASCARDTVEKGRNSIIEEAKDFEDQDEDEDEDRDENLKQLYEIRRVDEETWDKVMSLFDSCSCIDSILESPDNWDLLLNSQVFMRLLTVKLPNCQERQQELEHLGRYFQWALSRDDFRLPLVALCVTIYVFTLDFFDYGVGGNMVYWHLLWNYLLKRLRDKDSDIIVPARHLHRLLFAFTGSSDNAVAIEMLDHFEEFQCIPDYNYLWYNAFSMGHFLGGYKHPEPWELRLCQKLIDTLPTPNNDGDEDRKRCSDSILMYLTIKRPELAYAVYIAHKDKTPRKTIFIMIYRLSKGYDRWDLSVALDMLADQVPSSDQEAPALFNRVFCGLCRQRRNIERAKKFMAEMILKGPPPSTKAFHDFIELLCDNGHLEHALEMLFLMESRGLKPDVDTYCDIIRCHRRRGLMDQADKVFSMAKNKHPTCNDIRLTVADPMWVGVLKKPRKPRES